MVSFKRNKILHTDILFIILGEIKFFRFFMLLRLSRLCRHHRHYCSCFPNISISILTVLIGLCGPLTMWASKLDSFIPTQGHMGLQNKSTQRYVNRTFSKRPVTNFSWSEVRLSLMFVCLFVCFLWAAACKVKVIGHWRELSRTFTDVRNLFMSSGALARLHISRAGLPACKVQHPFPTTSASSQQNSLCLICGDGL